MRLIPRTAAGFATVILLLNPSVGRGTVTLDALLGLRELIKFGAVLDLRNHLVYLRASRPGENMASGIKSIPSRQGYTAVPRLLKDHHLFVAGALNGVPCHFVVDTGGYVTALDTGFPTLAKLKVAATRLVAEGFG